LVLLANVLMAVLGDQCIRQELAPNLVASGGDLRALVRARLRGQDLPDDSLLTQGWRAENILPELTAMLEGRRSLRIADIASEAPFALDDVPSPRPSS